MFLKLKILIAKYFTSFAFFYSFVRNRIFVALFLSIGVGVLDGLGLTMFLPLLQVVDEKSSVGGEGMGKLYVLVESLETMGISLTLTSVLLIMVIFFVLKAIFVYLTQVYVVMLQQGFIRKIRMTLVEELNGLGFKQFITSDVGRVQNTMTGEVNRVTNAFAAYFGTFHKSFMVLIYMGFAFLSNPKFAVLVSLGGGITYLFYRVVYTKTKDASRKLTRSSSDFQGLIIQYVAHFKYLKATAMGNRYKKKLKDSIRDIEESRKKIGVLNAIAAAVREPFLVIIIVTVIYFQIHFFGGTFASLALSLLFFYRALNALVGVQQSWNGFMANSGSLENMQLFHKELQRGKETCGKLEMKEFKREIKLNQVSFSYGEMPILNNVNLRINKNESIAFVGESGSGKTTLVNLIVGLLPESKGEILIDEHPLMQLQKDSYQRRIGYVSQDPVIFNDTIYNNITFWAVQTPENIKRFEKAVEQASLTQFLGQLPQGKETQLGNNGINLSGGQKQRVSIARELYKDIEILVLDEATSALDSETEKMVQESIESLQGKYTILSVAHRLATIKNADQIVFMEKGKILDIDDFENLQKKQERFKKMVELQEL